jgi:uncharacterized Zn-finger protein
LRRQDADQNPKATDPTRTDRRPVPKPVVLSSIIPSALGIGYPAGYAAAASGGGSEFTIRRIGGRRIMAENIVPYFHNTPGVAVIEIGAKEFMCVGELPPFDHPHVFLDMGDAAEIICPYCSTLFRYSPNLGPQASLPPECALEPATA